MAQKVSKLRAAACLNAGTLNKDDFELTKAYVEKYIKEDLQKVPVEQRWRVYQDAVLGFLMDLQSDTDDLKKIIKETEEKRKQNTKEITATIKRTLLHIKLMLYGSPIIIGAITLIGWALHKGWL